MQQVQQINVPEGWDIGGNTNGGYLMMVAAQAMRALAGRDIAVSVTGHFLRPVASGECEVVCQVLKQGKRLTTVRADLSNEGRLSLTMLGAFADHQDPAHASSHMSQKPPSLPPPQECVKAWNPPFTQNLYDKINILAAPNDAGILSGKPSGKGWFEAWISPPESAERATSDDLLLLVDCFAPPVFDLELPVNWTPTIELTVHVRGIPAAGWLRGRVATQFVSGGLLEETVELWDGNDQLVAQSRQISVEPRQIA